jgi:ABC-type phosphate transport system ATPase subunit
MKTLATKHQPANVFAHYTYENLHSANKIYGREKRLREMVENQVREASMYYE